MTAPRWASALLRRLAPPGRAEDVLGDLEEAHHSRVRRRGGVIGNLLTGVEALDVAAALMRERVRRRPAGGRPGGSEGTPAGGGADFPSFSRLDFKLGFRMLLKYPGLTLVGGLAISFAIAVGASTFVFVTDLFYPTLPLDDGDRIVELRNWDATKARVEARVLHDFVTWRQELGSVEDIGAYRMLERNLTTADGRVDPVVGAEISASGFRLARVRPLLGRVLVEADERPAAPPVVVIGYGVWEKRFGRDPDVVGQIVRLGTGQRTVVGVMPEGFAFPVSHNLWTPLRLNVSDYGRGQGPAIQVFGRLAPGVTLAQAQAELTTLGRRAAADFPETHERLRPEIMPYQSSAFHLSELSAMASLGLYSMNILFFVMLLVLVCANVALMVFARTATRASEIVVRNALGASRGRIIMQLFAEALVLGGVAAVVGLAAASFGLRWAIGVFTAVVGEGRLPFWFHDRLTPAAVLYAGMFTVLGAVVAGVVPALKVTGRGAQARLQRAAGGVSGPQWGGLWTGVIVTQVALTVAFVPIVLVLGVDTAEIRRAEVGFPAQEYLAVRLEMDRETSSSVPVETSQAEFLARFHASYQELERRVAGEPGVAGVTFGDQFPGAFHPRGWIEMDGEAAAAPTSVGHRAQMGSVDVDYFDVLGMPIVAGRGFDSGDLESDPGVVIVNEPFVREVLGDRNPIGRRVRYLNPEEPTWRGSPDQVPGPWYEIVGVVRGLTMTIDPDLRHGAGIYHPVAPNGAYPVRMAVHVAGDPGSFAPRLRALAAAVDPTLRLYELRPLDEAAWALLLSYRFWFWVIVLTGSIALLLSNAGIYSVMSFTVSRRTREIGVRVALGADRRHIVTAIFSRSLAQVGLGVIAGTGLIVGLVLLSSEGGVRLSATQAGLVVAYMALMMGVCMLACIEPARRALRIEPNEALRADG